MKEGHTKVDNCTNIRCSKVEEGSRKDILGNDRQIAEL